MKDQPKPASDEWTVRPVHKKDGTVWPGIGYISDGQRTYGSANFEEGKAIVAAINAALAAAWRKGHADAQSPALERIDELHQQLAAEREAREIAERSAKAWEQDAHRYATNAEDARQQLSAEREKRQEDCRLYERTIDAFKNQLAAEREITFAAQQAALKEGIRSGEFEQQLAAAEEKYENATDNLYRDIKRLNQQLAAERANRETVPQNWIRAEDNPGYSRHE